MATRKISHKGWAVRAIVNEQISRNSTERKLLTVSRLAHRKKELLILIIFFIVIISILINCSISSFQKSFTRETEKEVDTWKINLQLLYFWIHLMKRSLDHLFLIRNKHISLWFFFLENLLLQSEQYPEILWFYGMFLYFHGMASGES